MKKKCSKCKPKARAVVFDESQLVGMMLTEAKEQFPSHLIRAVIVDGNGVPVTCDMRPNRINVVVENGFIIAIDSHG